ncbi:UDP-3-O-(3-hydroxymyristoyl)glucosamine N-acyltransferase [Leeia sp. TBRC 13508]|uniref:UDP-3-O-acylglucosamine N-acyltransferase n=1 Tax=Leeia speluncae TaxID=2884804 RepID=A0ABS8D611_9NEIS|nr:UDP-3-O-(3-hydroxymyristoyl)glucosamine N-acyltransferase [Leeia speluncae]MCB6183602.1 UDP-3-O-(3-hydroxymyristoyl)glucosamine N-acyltransferase [Leeia speluncae]
MKLSEIVRQLGGQLAGEDVDVIQVAPLDIATVGQIAFLSNRKYTSQVSTTKAAAVILPENVDVDYAGPRIISANPYLYFAKVSTLLNPIPEVKPGIHPTAYIASTAKVSPLAEIGAFTSIEDGAVIAAGVVVASHCHVGANVVVQQQTRIKPNVTIYEGCQIGERVIVHSGVVIGSDGFGIANDQGRWVKIPQIGRVIIGNDVEIGANSTIDRGAMADTVIEDGVKLDNQIQVAHNVVIGAHTAIAGCVGIAGSAKIGKYCTIGGGAIVLGHLSIADRVNISAGTLITKSIKKPGTYTGIFPFDEHDVSIKHAVQIRQLGRLADRVAVVEKLIKQEKS